jgi:hypothetical protein
MPVLLSHKKAVVQTQRAAVLVRVPQHLEVPSLGNMVAGVAVPLAAVLVRVPQSPRGALHGCRSKGVEDERAGVAGREERVER